MKKIFYLLSACLCLALASCSNEKDIDLDTHDGMGLEFLHFASTSDSWVVSEEDESYIYNVPVGCTYSYNEDKTYNIKLGENTTGVEGKDFKIANKSVTIKAGEYLGSVPVEVLYDTTGEGFSIELVLDVEDKYINDIYGNSSLISVKTDKVTIDWAWLEGNWTAQDYNYYDGANDGDAYTAAIIKVDETNCIVRNLWGGGADFVATVDFDARTITVPGYQFLFNHPSYGADLYFVAVNPDDDYSTYADLKTPVVGTMSPLGIVFDNYDFLLVGGAYDGYTWAGGEKTTLTR